MARGVYKQNSTVKNVHVGDVRTKLAIITARKRSLRRLCFYRCLSVHRGWGHAWWGGGCAWQGGVHDWGTHG